MMKQQSELKVGVCGISGYAEAIHNHLSLYGPQTTPAIRLVAVCDPGWSKLGEPVRKLKEAGIEIEEDLEGLLGRGDLSGLWLPIPIDLHRPFTERALAAGVHVMCEKPAAGCIDDVDAMIAAEASGGAGVLIGYQDVYDPTTRQVKQMLLDGCIGRIERATLYACSPRSDRYFSRSAWSGRIRHRGRWVLDSPANNALSHYINMALLLMGPDVRTWATPLSVEAELYRAAAIENYDTISARATLDTGSSLLVLLTHAAETESQPIICIHGSAGRIECTRGKYRILTGGTERIIERPAWEPIYQFMVHAWARAMAGTLRDDELVATLPSARHHALLISGVSEATPVLAVDPAQLRVVTRPDGQTIHAIADIDRVLPRCAERHQMLHESGLLPFTQPPGRFDLTDYHHFTGGQTPAAVAAWEA